MKVEFTDPVEIDYIRRLIEADIKILENKLKKRQRVWSNIKFAQERGDF
jgi:hypothetical protein